MQFFLLFILAFIVGWVIYKPTRNWVYSVAAPMILFLISTLLDFEARDAWAFTLIFGLPLVFFASLLGAYVVQIRDLDDSEVDQQKYSDE